MNFSYQHVNPSTGGGSYLLRFRDVTFDRTPCVLVDSGVGVDLDSRLGDDEYLAAVLLTHAHLDHYATLADSLRDGAPVYAAEPTARILEDVLTEGEKNYEIGAADGVVDAIEPLDGWETVVPDVAVTPVPAGHAPGAAGFVVRFSDGSRANHLLFTGDFTIRPVAGYPGLDADLSFGVDALFVNVSTTDDFEGTLSDSLFTVVERARAGSRVLVSASSLTAVHYAYLLGHLGERLGDPVSVTLAGQAAKLYEDLGYEVPNVEPVPVFDSPGDVLERGTVTFAGPEVPVEGGSRRLFGAIAEDSSATLVQLTGGATDPIDTATCTVYDFEVVNHTSTEVIDDLVQRLNPIHVVAGHGPRRVLRNFRGRYDERFVWASDDDREQTLYEGGRWSSPPWLSDTAVQSIRAQDWRSSGGRFGELAPDGDVGVPPVARIADPDLEAEGLDVERLVARFGARNTTDANEDGAATAAAIADETPAADGAAETDGAGTATDAGVTTAETVEEAETFRLEVLERLDALESVVTNGGGESPGAADSRGSTSLRARVVDGGEDVTMLRLLDDADLDHGEEVEVVLSDVSDD